MEEGFEVPVYIDFENKQVYHSDEKPKGKNIRLLTPASETRIVSPPYKAVFDFPEETYEFQRSLEGAIIAVHRDEEGKFVISTRKKYDADKTRWNSREFSLLFAECAGQEFNTNFGVYVMVHPELFCVARDDVEPHLIDLLGNATETYQKGKPAGVYAPTILTTQEAHQRLAEGDNVVAVNRSTGKYVVLISDQYNYRKGIRGNQSVMSGFFIYAKEKAQDEATQQQFLSMLDPYHQREYANLNERVNQIVEMVSGLSTQQEFVNSLPSKHDIHQMNQSLLATGRFYVIYNDLLKRWRSYQRQMTLGEKAGLE